MVDTLVPIGIERCSGLRDHVAARAEDGQIRTIRRDMRRHGRRTRFLMSVAVGRLPRGAMAVFVAAGLVFLVSGSAARADTIVGDGLFSPYGVAVDGPGDVCIADAGNDRVLEHAAGAPAAMVINAQSAGSLTVAFTDASTAVSPATITGWSWNFGDGSPVSTQESQPRLRVDGEFHGVVDGERQHRSRPARPPSRSLSRRCTRR